MTKENKTQKLVETLQEAITTKQYSVGDSYPLDGETYQVVEVLGDGEYHLKNTKEPFNSFLTSQDEVTR